MEKSLAALWHIGTLMLLLDCTAVLREFLSVSVPDTARHLGVLTALALSLPLSVDDPHLQIRQIGQSVRNGRTCMSRKHADHGCGALITSAIAIRCLA
jgi:hypothetical protein